MPLFRSGLLLFFILSSWAANATDTLVPCLTLEAQRTFEENLRVVLTSPQRKFLVKELQERLDTSRQLSDPTLPPENRRWFHVAERVHGGLRHEEYEVLLDKLTAGKPLTSREGCWVVRNMRRAETLGENPLGFQVINLIRFMTNLPLVAIETMMNLGIGDYVGGGYEHLNFALRTNVHTFGTRMLNRIIKFQLMFVPSFRGIVYRGTGVSIDDARAMFRPGTSVKLEEFVSSSTEQDVAWNGFARGVYVEIGSRHGRDLQFHNWMENEVLFSSGTQFKVEEVIELRPDAVLREPAIYIRLVEEP